MYGNTLTKNFQECALNIMSSDKKKILQIVDNLIHLLRYNTNTEIGKRSTYSILAQNVAYLC